MAEKYGEKCRGKYVGGENIKTRAKTGDFEGIVEISSSSVKFYFRNLIILLITSDI